MLPRVKSLSRITITAALAIAASALANPFKLDSVGTAAAIVVDGTSGSAATELTINPAHLGGFNGTVVSYGSSANVASKLKVSRVEGLPPGTTLSISRARIMWSDDRNYALYLVLKAETSTLAPGCYDMTAIITNTENGVDAALPVRVLVNDSLAVPLT